MRVNKPSQTERLLRRLLTTMPTPSLTRRIVGFLARPWSIFVEITGVLAVLIVFFEVCLQTIPEIDANNSELSSVRADGRGTEQGRNFVAGPGSAKHLRSASRDRGTAHASPALLGYRLAANRRLVRDFDAHPPVACDRAQSCCRRVDG